MITPLVANTPKHRIGDRITVDGRTGKVMNPSFALGTGLVPVEFDHELGVIRGVPADKIEEQMSDTTPTEQAWPNDYNGVPVPNSLIADWNSPEAAMWRKGVDDAFRWIQRGDDRA